MAQIDKYGMRWPEGLSMLDIELWCYRHDTRPEGEQGRLTRFEHFQNAANLLVNTPRSSRKFVWNKWSNRMIQAAINHKYVGYAGSGSSGKSDSIALFMIVEFLSAPTQTLCLLLSTTLIGAKKRVWKSVNEFWSAIETQRREDGLTLPGKMVNSKGMLVGMDINGNWSEGVGLCLIAADKDNEKEAAKKLKGLKAPENGALRMAADEFSDLGESVLTAMVGNLNLNTDFKGFGMSNPGSKNTPFGKFVEPKNGWNSLSLGMEQWETKYGVCLSFDALNSPRMTELDGDNLYPWMPSRQAIEQAKLAFGEDSMEYWAQIRGMFCPTGMERTVWSEIELLKAREPVAEHEWDANTPIVMGRFNVPQRPRASALDPAFTTGGDRSPIIWAEFGLIKGVKVMNVMGFKVASEVASIDANGKELTDDQKISVSENIIDQFIQTNIDHAIPPHRSGYDATGGGTVFGQWLKTKWAMVNKSAHACHGIRFGEAPVERRSDATEQETVYANRVTQLWCQPKALVRSEQIRGIPQEVIEELCLRKWHEKKNTGSKTCVEDKPTMKKRTGKSPDLGDDFCILVDVAIQEGLLDVIEIRRDDRKRHQDWQQRVATSLGHGVLTTQKSFVAMPSTKRLKRV